jgi:hypothetical protein
MGVTVYDSGVHGENTVYGEEIKREGTGYFNVPGIYGQAAGSYLDILSSIESRVLDLEIGIEPGEDTASQIKRLYESNENTNAFTDADMYLLGQLPGMLDDKVDKTYVDNAVIGKADKDYVDNIVALKADKTEVSDKVDTSVGSSSPTPNTWAIRNANAGLTVKNPPTSLTECTPKGYVDGLIESLDFIEPANVSQEVDSGKIVQRGDNGQIYVNKDLKDIMNRPGWENEACSNYMSGVKDYGNDGGWSWVEFLTGDVRAKKIISFSGVWAPMTTNHPISFINIPDSNLIPPFNMADMAMEFIPISKTDTGYTHISASIVGSLKRCLSIGGVGSVSYTGLLTIKGRRV